jgi:hypothetical protein
LLAVISVQYDDITYDEPDHLQYGISILRLKSGRHVEGRDFNTTMPVTALNALPRAVEQLFNPGMQKSDWGESDIRNGRYISILVSIVLLLYIFLFAKAIAGFAAGCCAMFLAALDPNLLAHGRLVVTDIYSALGFVMTFYHLYEWLANKKQQHFFAWCFAIAFAQCCKVNNIVLYPLCILAIIAWRDSINRKNFWKRLLVFIAVQILVINLFFLFHGTGLSLGDHHFRSTFFQNLQHGFLSQLPLPFPEPYIDTFDLIRYEWETFDGIPMNYLLGELRYKQGFPSYYLVCWAFKTPLLTQLLLVVATIVMFIRNELRKQFIFFFLIPAVLLFILLSTSAVQTGYRYLLPVISMALVFCGVLIGLWIHSRPKTWQWAFFALPLIATITAFPNFIAYTNSLVPDKKYAYRYLADSNLNWGQRQKRVEKFLEDNPGYIFEPDKPVRGMIVVDLNKLVGINGPGKFEWLRKNHQPVATVDDCYLVYQVKD